MFWLWLGLKAVALAFKNPKPGQSQSRGFDWLWPKPWLLAGNLDEIWLWLDQISGQAIG
jgi:hypothetical protein